MLSVIAVKESHPKSDRCDQFINHTHEPIVVGAATARDASTLALRSTRLPITVLYMYGLHLSNDEPCFILRIGYHRYRPAIGYLQNRLLLNVMPLHTHTAADESSCSAHDSLSGNVLLWWRNTELCPPDLIRNNKTCNVQPCAKY